MSMSGCQEWARCVLYPDWVSKHQSAVLCVLIAKRSGPDSPENTRNAFALQPRRSLCVCRPAPLPFFLFPGHRSEVTGAGLTVIMRLNNLSGYVNDPILRKRPFAQHSSQKAARVRAAVIQRAGSLGASQQTFYWTVILVLWTITSRLFQTISAIKTLVDQTNEHCGHWRDIHELCWMFSLPAFLPPGLRVSVNWTCSQ